MIRNNLNNNNAIDKVVPQILLEERTVNKVYEVYNATAHQELKAKEQKHGMNAIINHILKSKVSADYTS